MSHRSFLGLAALEANRQGAFGKVWGKMELGYGYVIQGHVSVPFSVEWCCVNFLVIDSLALWFRLLVGPERHSGAWRRICS